MQNQILLGVDQARGELSPQSLMLALKPFGVKIERITVDAHMLTVAGNFEESHFGIIIPTDRWVDFVSLNLPLNNVHKHMLVASIVNGLANIWSGHVDLVPTAPTEVRQLSMTLSENQTVELCFQSISGDFYRFPVLLDALAITLESRSHILNTVPGVGILVMTEGFNRIIQPMYSEVGMPAFPACVVDTKEFETATNILLAARQRALT